MTKNSLNVKNRFSPSSSIVKGVFLESEIIKGYIDKFFKFLGNRRILFFDIVFIGLKVYSLKI